MYLRMFKNDVPMNDSGTPDVERFTPVPIGRSGYYLEKVEDRHIQDEISSYESGTDIHRIVAQYNQTGDERILSFDPSTFGTPDYKMPTSLREVYDIMNQSRAIYYNLSPEMKQKFPTMQSFVEFASNPANWRKASQKQNLTPQSASEQSNVKAGDSNA